MKIQILPSLLAADPAKLGEEALRAETAGADALHLDIMDGVFVPNISMGPAVVEMARKTVSIPLSVHLMLIRPDQYLEKFIDAGADSLLIHIEADCDVRAALVRIRELGVRPGITLNPGTPASRIADTLELVDEVLCMTVNPGYGGQAFIAEVLPKIREVRHMAQERGRHDLDIMVDGGVDDESAPLCAAEGANLLVAGTHLYRAPDMAAGITRMRENSQKAFA